MEGIAVLDKPKGISSAQAVNRVKRLLKTKKAGHTGTLDPLATGVLPVCLDRATRAIPFFDERFKEYEATMKLGVVTDTLDSTGTVLAENPVPDLDESDVLEVIGHFKGESEQTPPMYSALKKDGKRMYELARMGIEVQRQPRKILIQDIRLTGMEGSLVSLFLRCSKGTYVRSLVSDIGERIGCGAHLVELRRVRSGIFGIKDAITLNELENGDVKLLSIKEALSFMKTIEIKRDITELIKRGMQLKKYIIDDLFLPEFMVGERMLVAEGVDAVSVVEAKVNSDRIDELGRDDIVFKLLRVFE